MAQLALQYSALNHCATREASMIFQGQHYNGLLLPIFPIWSCRTYLHVRYGHKTQASLLSLSNQLEVGLSPIELNFYGMVCLSM